MIKVKHYRIPQSIAVGTKGKPEDLKRYSRGYGFSTYIYEGEAPRAKGGATSVDVVVDDVIIAIGDAECSLQDAFCYREGRRLAAERAVVQLLTRRAGLSERDAEDLLAMLR